MQAQAQAKTKDTELSFQRGNRPNGQNGANGLQQQDSENGGRRGVKAGQGRPRAGQAFYGEGTLFGEGYNGLGLGEGEGRLNGGRRRLNNRQRFGRFPLYGGYGYGLGLGPFGYGGLGLGPFGYGGLGFGLGGLGFGFYG